MLPKSKTGILLPENISESHPDGGGPPRHYMGNFSDRHYAKKRSFHQYQQNKPIPFESYMNPSANSTVNAMPT